MAENGKIVSADVYQIPFSMVNGAIWRGHSDASTIWLSTRFYAPVGTNQREASSSC